MTILNNVQVVDRTKAISVIPFKPSLIGALNLFRSETVASDAITFDVKDNSLFVLADHLRNTDGKNALDPTQFDIHTMAIPHYPIETTISRNKLAGLRGFGKETEDAIESAVSGELERHGEMHDNHYEYLQALMVCQGKIDTTYFGSIDMESEFGVTRSAQAFDFSDTAFMDAQLRAAQATAKKGLTNGGRVQGWVLLAGVTWFNSFVDHASVINGSQLVGDSPLRNQLGEVAGGYSMYRFGNVDVVLYDDTFTTKDGTTVQPLGDAEARLLPRTTLGSSFFGPVSKLSGIGAQGAKRFASSYRDPKDRYVEIESEQNTLVVMEQIGAVVELTIAP